MTEQKIDVSHEEAAILAEQMRDVIAAAQAAEQAKERLTRSFILFGRPRGIAPEATLAGVDPDEGWVRVNVPEQKPELVKDAG